MAICIFSITVLIFTLSCCFADLIVTLPDGQIQGSEIKINESRSIYKYRGIPYATPPLGKLRFLPPQPVEPWKGILDATQDGASCVFFGGYPGDPLPEKQSENCLFINVFTPTKNSSANLPVMVWIYGGGFIVGTCSNNFYDPAPFFDEDVVIVSFNYRLSSMGFLSTEDNVILGNAGLKDQLLALKWIQRNVGFFGGDPKKVTIFGESAGGMSVGYHIISKKSSGLFRAAICESGTSLTFITQQNARSFAYQLANNINSNISTQNSSIEIRNFLQNQPVELLVNLTLSIGQQVSPLIEVEDDDAFLTEPFFDVLQNGKLNKVPLILGHNSEESLASFKEVEIALQVAEDHDRNIQLLVPKSLDILPNLNSQNISDDIRATYVGKNGLFGDNLAQFLEWNSDDVFVRSIIKTAELQSQYTPVYLYQFSYNGTRSKNNIYIPGAGKVGHADDVAYLFNISTYPLETDADYLTRRRLVKLWTNFAKTLNPTPPEYSDLLQNVTWEVVKPDKIQYLDIDENLKMKPNRKVKEMLLWDYLWNTYGSRPFVTF